jgi:hypothetical protein
LAAFWRHLHRAGRKFGKVDVVQGGDHAKGVGQGLAGVNRHLQRFTSRFFGPRRNITGPGFKTNAIAMANVLPST